MGQESLTPGTRFSREVKKLSRNTAEKLNLNRPKTQTKTKPTNKDFWDRYRLEIPVVSMNSQNYPEMFPSLLITFARTSNTAPEAIIPEFLILNFIGVTGNIKGKKLARRHLPTEAVFGDKTYLMLL